MCLKKHLHLLEVFVLGEKLRVVAGFGALFRVSRPMLEG